jgi:hypothetical protein
LLLHLVKVLFELVKELMNKNQKFQNASKIMKFKFCNITSANKTHLKNKQNRLILKKVIKEKPKKNRLKKMKPKKNFFLKQK